MKITRMAIALIIVVAALLGTTMGVSAQTGTWVSGIMIQNQSTTSDANVTVTFYWAEGTPNAGQVAHSFTDVIAAGQAKSYYIPTDAKTAGLPQDFVGSAVVSSDQPVAANLNTQVPSGTGTNDPNNPNRVGTASGVLEPATKIYFTQVMKTYWGWNSYLAVQNTGAEMANVTIRYYNDANGTEVAAASQAVTIHPYSTYIFRQADNTNLPASWSGSAVVISDNSQPLAGVANFFNDGASKENAAFNSYNAFSSGATKLFVPRYVVNYYDYQGGLKIQNVGTSATNVTITYYMGGSTYTDNITGLAPNQAASFYAPNGTAVSGISGTGAAVIESSGQPIVATVNEDNRVGAAIPNHEGRGITYNAITDGDQTNAVLFPQITAKYYGYCGGPQVQNVGTAATTITAVFSMSGRTDIVVTQTVQPLASFSWFAPDVPGMAMDFNGSCVVSADQPLAGIANMSHRGDLDTRYGINYGDSYSTYNGINK